MSSISSITQDRGNFHATISSTSRSPSDRKIMLAGLLAIATVSGVALTFTKIKFKTALLAVGIASGIAFIALCIFMKMRKKQQPASPPPSSTNAQGFSTHANRVNRRKFKPVLDTIEEEPSTTSSSSEYFTKFDHEYKPSLEKVKFADDHISHVSNRTSLYSNGGVSCGTPSVLRQSNKAHRGIFERDPQKKLPKSRK